MVIHLTSALVVARKWGNSIGVTLPAKAIEAERIKPNDRLVISISHEASFKSLFGILKSKKSAQKMKDEMRAGWG